MVAASRGLKGLHHSSFSSFYVFHKFHKRVYKIGDRKKLVYEMAR